MESSFGLIFHMAYRPGISIFVTVYSIAEKRVNMLHPWRKSLALWKRCKSQIINEYASEKVRSSVDV